MMETIRAHTPEDIVLWPDGTWCFYEDLAEYGFMSDDFEVIPAGSARWEELEGSQYSGGLGR